MPLGTGTKPPLARDSSASVMNDISDSCQIKPQKLVYCVDRCHPTAVNDSLGLVLRHIGTDLCVLPELLEGGMAQKYGGIGERK